MSATRTRRNVSTAATANAEVTAARKSGNVRNLDAAKPVSITEGNVRLEVTAMGKTGLFTSGARCLVYVDGRNRAEKSLTAPSIAALALHADEITDAMEHMNRALKLGRFAPVKPKAEQPAPKLDVSSMSDEDKAALIAALTA